MKAMTQARQYCLFIGLILGLLQISLAQPSHIGVRPWASNILIPQSRRHGLNPSHNQAITITGVDVTVDILDRIATTTLEFSLQNTTRRRQEAELVMPVPAGAVVRGFAYDGPNAQITAEVLEKQEAKRIYEGLVSKLRDPALVEFIGYNLIRSSVFPIEAQGKQRVRLTYEHLLEVDGARIDYVLPRTESLQYGLPWHITANIKTQEPIATVYCPSHKVYTHTESETHISVKIDTEAQKQPGPFRLSYLLQEQGVTASLYAYPDDSVSGGYFLLVAGVPSIRDADLKPVKREVTLVIDRSGSMRNEKIEQAKEAALQVISGLKMGEAFNVIIYNNTVERFSETPVIKNRQTAKQVTRYIEGISATGGTNLHDALKSALQQTPTKDMLPLVLFLTDGLPTVGQTSETAIRDLVKTANPHRRRVFTFGVGYDVNTHLLEKLADGSKGRAEFVLPKEDVEVKVGKVFDSLSGPVLADVILKMRDKNGRLARGRTRDILPVELPDLYEDDQLVLLGQYVGQAPLIFEIGGLYFGKHKTFSHSVSFKKASKRHGFVPRLWASRKIAELIDLVREMGADPGASSMDPKVNELTEEIVRLSKEFGILTEYTAFLAREGTDLNDALSLNSETRRLLESRGMRARSGMGGMNQSLNMVRQKAQVQLNYSNAFYNDKMERVNIQSVQQVNDWAFYNKQGRWVDSRLSKEQQNREPDKVVEFGSKDYFDLAARLAQEGRQASLSFTSDVLLLVDGEWILVSIDGPQ
jgi:Ca-activated chloride channel homolog